jgi:chromosomal replication initiator protein
MTQCNNFPTALTCRPLQKYIHFDLIFEKACEFYGVTRGMLNSKNRSREYVMPRQIAMYCSTKYTLLSLKSIGVKFGGRDHTTVIYSKKTVNDLCYTDPDYRHRLAEFEAFLFE